MSIINGVFRGVRGVKVPINFISVSDERQGLGRYNFNWWNTEAGLNLILNSRAVVKGSKISDL